MRELMKLAESRGDEVSGSDLTLAGHSAENVAGKDLVVYTAAVDKDNVEIKEAERLKIPLLSRADFLGRLCEDYQTVIAVAGTHGKTTTTAMLWSIFAPFNPTVHIGGKVGDACGAVGCKKLFITEACEYCRSFLSLRPDIGLILNQELDHTDCYKNEDELSQAFKEFAGRCGTVVTDGSFIGIKVGEGGDYYATCEERDQMGRYTICIHSREKWLGRIKLAVSGRHNVSNALFAFAAASEYGLDFECIKNGLEKFTGVRRRFELLGKVGSKTVFSDYAHHPSEIKASLASARECGFDAVTLVFEPHTYSRTAYFFEEFVDALSLADRVLLLPIFAAREKKEKISSAMLARRLMEKGVNCRSFDFYSEANDYVRGLSGDGCVVYMGAGTVDDCARRLVGAYR